MLDQRNGQGALRSQTTFDVQRVFGRVFAQVALARRSHKTGDALALRPREQLPLVGRFFHSHRQQRNQLARILCLETDLNHIEVQQVLGVVQDVRLQQLDPLLHLHLKHFLRRQVGQVHARFVNRRQLLLLQRLRGDIPHGDDQVVQARRRHSGTARSGRNSSGCPCSAASRCWPRARPGPW